MNGLNTMVHRYNEILFSFKKKRKHILSFAAKWVELEDNTLGEITNPKRQIPQILPYVWEQNFFKKNHLNLNVQFCLLGARNLNRKITRQSNLDVQFIQL